MLNALSTLLLLFPVVQGGTDGSYEVLVEEVSGDLLCSVRARKASVHDLVSQIAKQSGRDLTGFDLSRSTEAVTVRLDARPMDQALHYLLGAAGFRAEVSTRSIMVRPELPPFPEEADLLDAADLAYQRALRFHANSPNGDQAELALARIQDRLGNAPLSRGHYEVLIDEYPNSNYRQEALVEAGRLLKRERNWEDAAVKYRSLIEMEREDLSFEHVLLDNPYAIEARINLARCSAQLGNYQHALHGLDNLDNLAPAQSPEERGRRNYVRARALIGKQDFVEALRLLQRADTQRAVGDYPGERVELIAEALSLSGRPADASLAWLQYSQRAYGSAQADALKRSAKLALEAGDELGALMICRQGEAQGHGEALAELQNQARARLDFVERDLIQIGFEQRLVRGEALVSQGQTHEAYLELQRLEQDLESQSSGELARFALAYGTCLEAEVGIEQTVRFLRKVLPLQPDIEHRRNVYRLAARLFEKNEMFDQAINALGGKL